ncbi:Beta-fructofuranosidase, insoluble isoenzyme 7 [Hordeum vulgare]|nr:Beta-fructofuranosidase, insoluble isoenzyme 7 [Hordeum vulgare]
MACTTCSTSTTRWTRCGGTVTSPGVTPSPAALDTALNPNAPFDANGCWSGSATILPGGVPAMLYTVINANNVPAYNPIIPHPADVPDVNFRDPSTPWVGSGGLWHIAAAAKC